MQTSMSVKGAEVSDATSASLDASYEGFGVSGSASSSFDKKVSSNNEITSKKTTIHMEGQDLGYMIEPTDTAGAM